MYPELFKIGPFPIHSYGLMLGIAFLIGSTIFSRELKRQKLDESFGVSITFLAIIGGLIGSKLFYIIEEWNFGQGAAFLSYFRSDVLFSPSGLTFYGGLILAIIFIWIFCKIKKLKILQIFDALSPAAILSYGIARIGCHLSGDGCYGIPVNGTFWEFLGLSYSKGIIKPIEALRDFPNLLKSIRPDQTILVHPTPLYELAAGIIIFFVLMALMKRMKYFGQLFFIYLIFAGIERLLVEFIRLNKNVIYIFSQAQLISIIMIVTGLTLLFLFKNKSDTELLEINSINQKT